MSLKHLAAVYVFQSCGPQAGLWLQLLEEFSGTTETAGRMEDWSPADYLGEVIYARDGSYYSRQSVTTLGPMGFYGFTLRSFSRRWKLQVNWRREGVLTHRQLAKRLIKVIRRNPDTFDSGRGASSVIRALERAKSFDQLFEVLQG